MKDVTLYSLRQNEAFISHHTQTAVLKFIDDTGYKNGLGKNLFQNKIWIQDDLVLENMELRTLYVHF